MHIAEYLEVLTDYCRVYPRGAVSLVDAVELVTRAIVFCRDQKIPKLLVNVTALTHAIPTLVDRYLMAEEWAREARGMVIVAVVAAPQHIDPEKFGVKVAMDFGLKGNVFTSEHAARVAVSREPKRRGPDGHLGASSIRKG